MTKLVSKVPRHSASNSALFRDTKRFIRSWDFANPRWDNLPQDFPNCDLRQLTTKEEKHLFGAIKTAWIISGGGRKHFYKNLARQVLVGLTAIVVAVLIARNLTAISQKGFAGSVSAKTAVQTVGKIIESTTSAILRLQ